MEAGLDLWLIGKNLRKSRGFLVGATGQRQNYLSPGSVAGKPGCVVKWLAEPTATIEVTATLGFLGGMLPAWRLCLLRKRPVAGRVAELSWLRRGMDVSRPALGQQRTTQAVQRGCLYRTSFFVFLSTTRRCQKGRRIGTTPPS